MSDFGRKDFGDKAQEKFTPDSTKSTQDKLKEGVTDTTDKISRGIQPDNSKSDTQAFSDKAGRAKDEHVHGGTGESILDKTKDALGLGKK